MSEMPYTIKDFLSYMETIKGKSKNTAHEYYYDLRLFFRFMKIHKNLVQEKCDFDKIDISDIDIDTIKKITLSDLYAYMSFLSRERDNNSSSRARKVASIKSFFNYITNKAKLLDYNPASELESPKILKRLPKYLNVEESKKLLEVIDGEYSKRDYAIMTLFLNCGLRLSELVSININKIKNETLTIIGKGDKERVIYLNKACINAINSYLKVRPSDYIKDKNALFLSKRKQRISTKTVQHIVKKYLKAAGLDTERYSVHKLRHTAATLMYKYGNVDIRALQEILGHESISTTEIYTHVDSDQLKNALDSNPLSEITFDED
ncbi:tyrosine recombinase XerC [Herbivorax sp. ANBcel31]|uniref:tyrosine recombinase XerC n=1 Tax=Herbivorax sp. ANBcel31 TaxID=3069754 RepID=UPI0027B7A683|nr:tyrosine recombinase XerC [Herbivorax sp. ANBcel31]MDQ2085804.1 tyrosine recombinase XerC [Herbivorax sp. ANBcel31]